jgi:hypothetical protein
MSNYENGETAGDVWDKNQWSDVDIDMSQIGGIGNATYLGPRTYRCPLQASKINVHGTELDKCLSKCAARNAGYCNGFNGSAPSPARGAKITFE